MNQSTLTDVAHVIQLSVAPVFLLTSVGTILSVLSSRLSRVVDRARVLHDRISKVPSDEAETIRRELHLLANRRHLINVAITAGVCAALFVCMLIAIAFIGSVLAVNTSIAVATMFIAAMVAFVVALLMFLREVLMAVASVRIE
jgi:hypothetical protein